MDTLEIRVAEVLKSVFELESVDASCSQKSCGAWDSMGQLNLTVELEDTFGVTLEPEEIGRMKCFADIIEILKAKGIK